MHAVEPYCSTCVFHVTSVARETCALRGWREIQGAHWSLETCMYGEPKTILYSGAGINSHASSCVGACPRGVISNKYVCQDQRTTKKVSRRMPVDGAA